MIVRDGARNITTNAPFSHSQQRLFTTFHSRRRAREKHSTFVATGRPATASKRWKVRLHDPSKQVARQPAASQHLENPRATAMQTVAATVRRSLRPRRSLESDFPAFLSGVASKSIHPNSRSWPNSRPPPTGAQLDSWPINPSCFQTCAKAGPLAGSFPTL